MIMIIIMKFTMIIKIAAENDIDNTDREREEQRKACQVFSSLSHPHLLTNSEIYLIYLHYVFDQLWNISWHQPLTRPRIITEFPYNHNRFVLFIFCFLFFPAVLPFHSNEISLLLIFQSGWFSHFSRLEICDASFTSPSHRNLFDSFSLILAGRAHIYSNLETQ